MELEAAPLEPVDLLEYEVVAKVMDAAEDGTIAAAIGALREATRESAERRRALCTPRCGGCCCSRATRPPSSTAPWSRRTRSASCARGAVPALVEVLRSVNSVPEALEHAAGALFGLALNEDNRATIGVLGAVPPLLELLTSPGHPPRAHRDARVALYHLSLAAVNQTKVARFPGAPKALLAVASGAAEPGPIRRLALMVACNVAACSEGRAALMDAGAVASVAGIPDGAGAVDLKEWRVSAMYVMSRSSLQFRGLRQGPAPVLSTPRTRAGCRPARSCPASPANSSRGPGGSSCAARGTGRRRRLRQRGGGGGAGGTRRGCGGCRDGREVWARHRS
jgi:hypothetical protein